MKRIFGGSRYANVTATMALILALGGTAYATGLANNSVGTHQLKARAVHNSDIASNAVTSGKVKNGSLLLKDFKSGQLGTGGTGPQGPKGPTGPVGPTGPSGSGARWALINKAHTAILAQSGGISISGTSGSGVYLNMGSDVTGKVVQATNAFTDDDNLFRGAPIVTICGGGANGGTCAAGSNDTSHVWVATTSTANAAENHAVYVVVL